MHYIIKAHRQKAWDDGVVPSVNEPVTMTFFINSNTYEAGTVLITNPLENVQNKLKYSEIILIKI